MDKKQELVNSGINFKAISCTLLRAEMPNLNYEIVTEGRDIHSIVYREQSISIGDEYYCSITTKKDSPKIAYKVNAITVNDADERCINLFESLCNNTTLFVLPLVIPNMDDSGYVMGNTGYLINAYVSCNFRDSNSKYSMFILLKHIASNRFKLQEKIYTSNENFVKAIDVDKNHVLYEFSVPKKFHNDYDLLLDGKYSKLSEDAVNQILRFHGTDVTGSIVNDAISKNPKRRQGIASEFNVNLEDIEELHPAFNHNDILSKNML